MKAVWWLVHIVGIALWFGVTTAALLVWSSIKSVREENGSSIILSTLISILNRTGRLGALLTALGGTALSFMVQPKSKLGLFWLTVMQGFGVIAFFLTILLLRRYGQRIEQSIRAGQSVEQDVKKYHFSLIGVFLLLFISLCMAALKPVL